MKLPDRRLMRTLGHETGGGVNPRPKHVADACSYSPFPRFAVSPFLRFAFSPFPRFPVSPIRRFAVSPFLLLFLILLNGPATAGLIRDPLHDATREGRQLYDQKKFPQSMEAFGRGRETAPDHPVLAFNVGDALLAMGKPDEALQEFQKAMRTNDPGLKARTLYNMGNAFFQKQDFQKAVDNFRQSLLLSPRQEDAKRNLELAAQALRQQQSQQQQNQSGQKQPQDGQQNPSGQQSGGKNQEDQSRSRPEQPKPDQNKSEQSKQSQAKQQDARQEQGKEQPAQQQKEGKQGEKVPARRMDPAQAAQLLQALASQEKEELWKLRQSMRKSSRKEGKDW